MNYKKVLSAGMSGFMMLSVIAPSFALAEEKRAFDPVAPKENFCSRLANFEKEINRKNEKLGEKRVDYNEDRISKMKDNWANFDAKRDEKRAQEEANKAERYTKLESRLKTDGQKTALEAFKASVSSALKVRKDAVDLAVKNYRDGIAKLVNDKKTSMDMLLTTNKVTMAEALAKAKADCAGGVDAKTVKENFIATQKSAQEKMKAGHQAINNIAEGAKVLIEARKQAVNKGQTDFKASIEKAKADLKLALSNSTSPTPATTTQ